MRAMRPFSTVRLTTVSSSPAMSIRSPGAPLCHTAVASSPGRGRRRPGRRPPVPHRGSAGGRRPPSHLRRPPRVHRLLLLGRRRPSRASRRRRRTAGCGGGRTAHRSWRRRLPRRGLRSGSVHAFENPWDSMPSAVVHRAVRLRRRPTPRARMARAPSSSSRRADSSWVTCGGVTVMASAYSMTSRSRGVKTGDSRQRETSRALASSSPRCGRGSSRSRGATSSPPWRRPPYARTTSGEGRAGPISGPCDRTQ